MLGIISGASGLPAKWVDACSDKIATWTIRRDAKLNPPSDISALCERLVQQTPVVLRGRCRLCGNGSYEIEPAASFHYKPSAFEPFRQVRKHFRPYTVIIKYDEELVKISEGKEKSFLFKIYNEIFAPQYLTVRFLDVPEDWEVENGCERCVGLEHWHGSSNENSFAWKFIPRNLKRGKYTLIVEISAEGKGEKNYIPMTFINGAC